MNAEIKAVLQEMRDEARQAGCGPIGIDLEDWADRLESLLQPEQVAAQSERERFHSAMEELMTPPEWKYSMAIQKSSGKYHSKFVQDCWQLWQAATSRTTPQQEWQPIETFKESNKTKFCLRTMNVGDTEFMEAVETEAYAKSGMFSHWIELEPPAMSAAPQANSSGG